MGRRQGELGLANASNNDYNVLTTLTAY